MGHNSRTQSKLLSVVITGRNDDYLGNFKYRLTTCINYIARNLKGLRRLGDVEILVVDWNSEVPLSSVLKLSPEAGQMCCFIRVPPRIAIEKQRPDQVFNTSCAVNVGLRRARGNFLMIMGADTLFPSFSLRILLQLLDGEIPVPFNIDSCLFLGGRKFIPWDTVHCEPSLDEWDQYLSLNSGELEGSPKQWPGLGVGCSALMMHSSLWHACHGFDEQLSDWGWSDAELTLRITQYHPWMELLSIGVLVFDMEHWRQNFRLLEPPKQNPHKVHLSFAVNDENWGLENYDLDIQTAKITCELPEAGKLSAALGSIKTWNKTYRELLAEMTDQEVHKHLQSITQSWWNINPPEWESLCAVAWYSLHCFPRRYLEFGIRNGYTAAAVAAACPSVEIYGVDSWQAKNSEQVPSPASSTGLLHSIGYRGYLRLVTGDSGTAFKRLRDSLLQPLSLNLVLLRGDIFGSYTVQQLSEIAPHLTPGGAIVFTCNSEALFESVWSQVRAKLTQFTYLRCKTGKTGLILAVSLQNDNLSAPSDEENGLWVDFGKPPKLRRLYRALKNPTKYLEYAKRICRIALGYLIWGLARQMKTMRREQANWISRYLLRRRVQRIRNEGKPLKIVVGAASTSYESWLSTDLPILDALNPAQWRYLFPRDSIDKILAEHVIEHWKDNEFRSFLKVVRPFLSEQGFIRIAVPDGFHPDPSYIDYVKPGGSGSGADDHKVLYDYITITRILSEEQYDYNLLEYFDEAGQFHCSPWEISDGFVERSADHDPRNEKCALSYTSLIVDAWPRGD